MIGTRIGSINLGGGSNSPFILEGRSGEEAITSGQDSVAVTFVDPFGDDNYSLAYSIKNTVDGDPVFLIPVTTTKNATGFVVTFNAPADSSNYVLQYLAAGFV